MFWFRATLCNAASVHSALAHLFKGSHTYLMPRRQETDFNTYPYAAHGIDCTTGTLDLLRRLGFWFFSESIVQGVGVAHLGATSKERNLRELRKALEGAERLTTLPEGFGISATQEGVVNGEWSLMAVPELSVDGTFDCLSSVPTALPSGPEQYFSMQNRQMSVFIQTKGEFLWVFTRAKLTISLVTRLPFRT
jgi:hypothetical protein